MCGCRLCYCFDSSICFLDSKHDTGKDQDLIKGSIINTVVFELEIRESVKIRQLLHDTENKTEILCQIGGYSCCHSETSRNPCCRRDCSYLSSFKVDRLYCQCVDFFTADTCGCGVSADCKLNCPFGVMLTQLLAQEVCTVNPYTLDQDGFDEDIFYGDILADIFRFTGYIRCFPGNSAQGLCRRVQQR